MHGDPPRRPSQGVLQSAPAPHCPFRQIIRAPGRHGSVRATKEAALQALADTKARVSQAMEDTVAIRSNGSMDEVSRAPSSPHPLAERIYCRPASGLSGRMWARYAASARQYSTRVPSGDALRALVMWSSKRARTHAK